ncbi:MAG: hypothetical protein ACOZIN_22230 [Myxococcota bacterium]
MLPRLVAILAFSVLACGPSTDISVSDHSDALTGNGHDNLFQLKVLSIDALVPIAQVQLSVAPPGQTQQVVEFAHDDADGDGKLGPNDILVGKESEANRFDGGDTGTEYRVLLLRDRKTTKLEQLAQGSWTPAN